jgi:hypothetical protein
MAKTASLLSSSSMVLDTTLDEGSGGFFEVGLAFSSLPVSWHRSVFSPEMDRFDNTVVALPGVSIVDDGVTPRSGMYDGGGCDDCDTAGRCCCCCCKAEAAADRWSSEFWSEFCGDKNGDALALLIRCACSCCRCAEWTRAGLMAPASQQHALSGRMLETKCFIWKLQFRPFVRLERSNVLTHVIMYVPFLA